MRNIASLLLLKGFKGAKFIISYELFDSALVKKIELKGGQIVKEELDNWSSKMIWWQISQF